MNVDYVFINSVKSVSASWSSGMILALGITLKSARGPAFESRWSPFFCSGIAQGGTYLGRRNMLFVNR